MPAGAPLKGLNYLKGRDDPLALKEDEYPEWLWRCLDVVKKGGDEDVFEGDEFCTWMPFSSYFWRYNFVKII